MLCLPWLPVIAMFVCGFDSLNHFIISIKKTFQLRKKLCAQVSDFSMVNECAQIIPERFTTLLIRHKCLLRASIQMVVSAIKLFLHCKLNSCLHKSITLMQLHQTGTLSTPSDDSTNNETESLLYAFAFSCLHAFQLS